MRARDPRSKPSTNLSRLALGAAAVAVLARLPFIARRLWDHDSVQFALGVERFDLAAHQPHPPGYPLYIGLLKALAALGLEPLAGMVLLSVAAGAVGAAALVLLAARLASQTGPRAAAGAGLFAGALYATNPLLWFYGELPLVYAVEGGMTVAVAWAVGRMSEGGGRFLLAPALLALAGGLRPSTMALLAPLLVWGLTATWRRGRLTVKLLAGGAAVGAAVTLLWLLPLLAAAGGFGAYREIAGRHFGALLPQTSVLHGAGLPALLHNLELLAKWAAQGLFPALAALAMLALLARRLFAAGLRLALPRLGFLAAWALPPMAFFALFHITKAGYTLVHLPALLAACAVIAAPALDPSSRQRSSSGTRPGTRAVAAALLAAALGGGLFLFGRDRPTGSPRWLAPVLHEFHRTSITAYEAELDEALAAVRRLPPETSVLVTVELAGGGAAGSEDFLYPWQRHLQWYLPQYPLLFLAPDAGLAEETRQRRPFRRIEGAVELPAGTERLVFVLSGPTGERLPLPPGEVLVFNQRFRVLAGPFPGELVLGPFRLRRGLPPGP